MRESYAAATPLPRDVLMRGLTPTNVLEPGRAPSSKRPFGAWSALEPARPFRIHFSRCLGLLPAGRDFRLRPAGWRTPDEADTARP